MRRLTPRPTASRQDAEKTLTAHVQNVEIRAGSRVEHASFGVGTVLRIENNMTGLKAIIQFTNCGEKTLLLKFAKLNVLE